MRRSTIFSAVGVALSLSWTSVATADGTPLSQQKLEGRVVSVDVEQRSLQIATAQADGQQGATTETKKLTVAPNAHVIRDGRDVPSKELKAGDQVRASFLSDDLARSHPWQIEAQSPRGRQAPPAPAAR